MISYNFKALIDYIGAGDVNVWNPKPYSTLLTSIHKLVVALCAFSSFTLTPINQRTRQVIASSSENKSSDARKVLIFYNVGVAACGMDYHYHCFVFVVAVADGNL